jgi:catechol 2,3-dioxygenase-like lactoylglutathione lyase family enzyme
MITGVGSVSILVSNAKKSAEWYRDKLGFEIVAAQGHSVFVKPRNSQTPLLHLCGQCDAWEKDRPGGRTGIWLQCGEIVMRKDERTGRLLPASSPDNVEKTYLELKEGGVEFAEKLITTEWGKCAILKDPDGNELEIS